MANVLRGPPRATVDHRCRANALEQLASSAKLAAPLLDGSIKIIRRALSRTWRSCSADGFFCTPPLPVAGFVPPSCDRTRSAALLDGADRHQSVSSGSLRRKQRNAREGPAPAFWIWRFLRS